MSVALQWRKERITLGALFLGVFLFAGCGSVPGNTNTQIDPPSLQLDAGPADNTEDTSGIPEIDDEVIVGIQDADNGGAVIGLVATDISYPVNRVVDGDTIEVIVEGRKEKVRLIGINTPESVDPRRDVECFGKEASEFASQLMDREHVSLVADTSQDNRDKYDRLLRYVFLEDGTHVNLKLVQEGYAYEFTYNLPYRWQKEFIDAQKDAEKNGRGLWGEGGCEA